MYTKIHINTLCLTIYIKYIPNVVKIINLVYDKYIIAHRFFSKIVITASKKYIQPIVK